MSILLPTCHRERQSFKKVYSCLLLCVVRTHTRTHTHLRTGWLPGMTAHCVTLEYGLSSLAECSVIIKEVSGTAAPGGPWC